MYPPLAAFSTRLDVPSHYLTVFIPLAVNVSFPNHIPPLLTASFIPFTTFGPVSISHLNFFFFHYSSLRGYCYPYTYFFRSFL